MKHKNFKIIKASAGSGKTYTLVLEYLKLTLLTKDPTIYRQINAMTFTNKASLEMKERILEALIILSSIKPNLEQTKFIKQKSIELKIPVELIQERSNIVLNSILHHYSEFNIQTLDSFTSRIVRTFANDISFSNDFDIEINSQEVLSIVIEKLVEEVGSNKEITQLLQKYSEYNIEDEKNWDITRELNNFVSIFSNEKIIRELEKFEGIDQQEIYKISNKTFEFVKSFHSQVIKISNEALEVYRKSSFDKSLIPVKIGLNVINTFNKAIQTPFKYPFTKTAEKIVKEKKSWFKKGENYDISSFKEFVEQKYLELQQVYKKHFENYKLNLIVKKNILNILLLHKIKQIYEEVKQELNVIPLSDFNQLIQRLIENEPTPFIYERLGTRFQNYLLDEFQDTSVLQWKNLIPLIENGLSAGHLNLIVGDAKQAIYRWRNGDVEQFIKLPQLDNPENNKLTQHRSDFFQQLGYTNVLDTNFRSKKEIIEFNNEFFERLSRILPEKYKGVYELNSLRQKSSDEFGGGYVQYDTYTGEFPKNYLENIIESVLKEGYQQKDICIIVRGNDFGVKISNHLIKKGYTISSAQLLKVSSELNVQFIIILFEYFLNPFDESIKRLLAEKYIQIKINDIDNYDFFQKYIEVKEINKKKIDVYNIIKFFNYFDIDVIAVQNIIYESLYELGQKLMNIFKISINNNAYVQLISEFLYQFDQKPNATLGNFIKWYKENGKNKSIQISEKENAIKVMTIHKSKGLQFPIVICPNLNDNLNAKDNDTMIPMSEFQPCLPSVLTSINSNLLKDTKYEKHKINEVEKVYLDFVNLVYVAFTRAVDRLYFMIDLKNKGGKELLKSIDFLGDKNYYGTKIQSLKQTQKNQPKIMGLNTIGSKLWFPDISFKSDEIHLTNQFDKIEYGKNMHLFLSELSNNNHPNELMNLLINNGKIKKRYSQKILIQTKNLLKNVEIKKLIFSKGKIEQEILQANEKKLRPDKMIFDEQSVIIIDFKTGVPNEKDKLQINKYKTCLSNMGYFTKSYLIYTEKIECLEV